MLKGRQTIERVTIRAGAGRRTSIRSRRPTRTSSR